MRAPARSALVDSQALARVLAACRRAAREFIRTGLERDHVLAIGVAALLLVASVLSLAPGASAGATGNVYGPTTFSAFSDPRLAIGGGYVNSSGLGAVPPAADAAGNPGYGTSAGSGSGQPNSSGADGGVLGVTSSNPGTGDGAGTGDVADHAADQVAAAGAATTGPATTGTTGTGDAAGTGPAGAATTGTTTGTGDAASPAPSGAYLPDGTLLKPVAVDTSVPDAKDRLTTYHVRAGDTLTGIARAFGVNMMTLWWANDLASKDALHIGQALVIPPVDGLVVTVKAGDTLAALAKATGVGPDRIARYNGLATNELIVGQTLIVPGGRGDAIPTPSPATASAASGAASGGSGSSGGSTGGSSARPPTNYAGGRFAFPVPSGYISQYFHYGHWALDIAASWGDPVLAGGAGTVIFAGWKNNGGGYQVWISHGSNIYTTYNHMSSLTVGIGERVARGQQVGRIGATGDATGPHLHFEVWIGPIWNGGTRVNPLGYL